MLSGLVVFGTIVAAVIWFVTAYNNLVTAAQRADQAWGNIDALLRQRHDEIPKLIDLCQRHLKYEQATFDRVLEARSEIFGARQTQDTAVLGRAENVLRSELTHLLGLAAANTELNADPALAALQQRLATLENGIAERGEIYNDAVRQNNLAIGRFPGSIVAILGGFRRLQALAFDPGRGGS
jgi:LemA protein